MPERDNYSHLFKRNPFKDKNPEEVFSLLHWGNSHNSKIEIDAPEPLVMLGMIKLLVLPDRKYKFSDGESFLSLGVQSNSLYLIPRVNDLPILNIPPFSVRTCKYIGPVLQTDYLAAKGGEIEDYYYHKHEKPYPGLWLNNTAGIGYIIASDNNGKPSYAVGKEGIVG